jgi:protein phosphatase PTC7
MRPIARVRCPQVRVVRSGAASTSASASPPVAARFPCRRWLGFSDAGGAAFPEEQEFDVLPASGGPAEPPPPPAPLLARPLALRAGGAAVPHPDKVKAGARATVRADAGDAGEDAYFITRWAGGGAGALALGVSDGVYMWRERGIDAGAFSRALCAAGARAAASASAPAGTPSPMELLQAAYGDVMAAGVQGSATVCVVLLDAARGVLRSANVGDSGYLLMTPRRRAVGGGGAGAAAAAAASAHAAWQPCGVRFRTPHQEHEFGRPYQLGHHRGSDRPEDAMLHAAAVAPGDALILGSDGLWDNLHDSEVAALVQDGVEARAPPAAIARAVAAAAYERSTQKRGSTPYSTAATENFDMVYCGGKRDDITVLCLLVEEAHAA